MDGAQLWVAEKLSRALKQCDQAQRNLRTVELWAGKRMQGHLEHGTRHLIDHTARLASDIRSLISIVRAQAKPIAVLEEPRESQSKDRQKRC